MNKYKFNFFDNFDVVKSSLDKKLDSPDPIQRIIIDIRRTAFEISNEEELRLYIRNSQKALLIRKEDGINSIDVDEILYSIESMFNEYINKEERASSITIDSFKGSFLKDVSEVSYAIKKNISTSLFEVIEPLFNFSNSRNWTLHNIEYLSAFWNTFFKMHSKFEAFSNKKLYNFLIKANFNDLHFFNYYIDEIRNEINMTDDYDSQIHGLLRNKKELGSIAFILPIKYNSSAPSILDLIKNWLKWEIKAIREILETYNPQQTKFQFLHSDQKILTSFSVNETAFLAKLFYKTGIFINEEQTEILKVMANSFSTKKQPNISFDSIFSKYYNTNDTTKQSVKEKLKQVVNFIDKIE